MAPTGNREDLLALLRSLRHDPSAMRLARRILATTPGGGPARNSSDDAVLRQLTSYYRPEPAAIPAPHDAGDTDEPDDAGGIVRHHKAAKKKKRSYADRADAVDTHEILIQVKDARNSLPIDGVELTLTQNDAGGGIATKTTKKGGLISHTFSSSGSVTISCPFGGWDLARTLCTTDPAADYAVAKADKRPVTHDRSKCETCSKREPTEPPTPLKGRYRILSVKAVETTAGTNLDQLAKDNGLAGLDELLSFNLGRDATGGLEPIELFKRAMIGCTQKSRSGQYFLDAGDDPAVVFVPADYEHPTTVTPKKMPKQEPQLERPQLVIEVQPVVPRLDEIRFWVQRSLPPCSSADSDERAGVGGVFVLESHDGKTTYRHTAAATEKPDQQGRFLTIAFPHPPREGTYELYFQPADDGPRQHIAESRSYAQLVGFNKHEGAVARLGPKGSDG